MTCFLSIHAVKSIRANAGDTSGAPLILEIKTDAQLPQGVTLFTNDPVLNERLAEAINKIAEQRWEEKHVVEQRVASEGQAYAALDRVQDYNHRPDDDEEFVF